jgi:ABC-type microcin C transport system duplicated ATPase subunit YejF
MVVIDEGRIVQAGTMQEVFEAPKTAAAARLVGAGRS